ncbi:CIS tube protein [Phormidesmis priestleyi]
MVLGGVAGAIGGAISALTGAGASEKLEKLIITPLSLPDFKPSKTLQPIEVLFNPTTLSITKPVTWREPQPPQQSTTPAAPAAAPRKLNAPEIEFSGGGSRTLTLELLFDVTELVEIKGQKTPIPDVRTLTNKIVELTRIQRGQSQEEPPPVCQLAWGNPPKGSDFPFKGVITNLTQNFTLFRRNGQPVRATLSVQFREYLIAERDKKEIDPEFTTRVVVRGDTVSSIAADVYRDPKQWRVIADANRLDDPRRLGPGQRLNIPKLR